MTVNRLNRRKSGARPVAIPPMPDYNARVLAYLASAATIIAGIYVDHFSAYLIWLVPVAMLWPHLLYFTLRYLKKQSTPQVRQNLLIIDALAGGIIIVLMDFSLAPTLYFLLMLNFSFIIVGGMPTWIHGNLATLAGFTVTSIYHGLQFSPTTPPLVILVGGIGVAIYICVTAYYTHQQARALVQAKSLIQSQRSEERRVGKEGRSRVVGG